jgi:hypothetical protein
LLAACASPPGGFDSPEPASKLTAITDAAERNDRSAIPHLIEALDNDDPVVRLAAIRALQRMTGQTLGYDYADHEWKRKQAADAWQRWYQLQSGPGAGPAMDRKSEPSSRLGPGSGAEARQRFGYKALGPIEEPWG